MTSRMDSTDESTSGQQLTIVDNETRNGVWVNGRRIPLFHNFRIQVGNSIEIGLPGNGNGPERSYIPAQQSQQNVLFSVTRQTNEVPDRQKTLKRKRTEEEEEEEEDEPSTSQPKRFRRGVDGETRQTNDRADNQKTLKRKRTEEDSEEDAEPSTSQPKRVRCSIECRWLTKRVKQSLQQDIDRPHSDASDTPDLLQMYSQNIEMLQQQIALLEERHRGLSGADQFSEEKDFLQTIQIKMKTFEKSLIESKQQLEKTEQREDSLKYLLEETLQERKKVMQEITDYQQRLEDILLDKNQELEKQKDEAEAQKHQVVTQVTEVMENELQCLFCTEFLIEARILNCGHAFCRACIRRWRDELRNDCPVCRTVIVSQTRCLAMDNCIDGILEKLSPDVKARRQAVIDERNAVRNLRERGGPLPWQM